MRSTLNFNSHWQFTKPGAAPVAVTLPHTWNAADGTDGGNDYFRGTCTYTKEFAAPAHADDEEVWLEFEGAAMTAVVTLNDQELTRHAGGYSTFRVNLTPALAAQNTLTVTVDNSANRTVYPQKADFTFYGGLYRLLSTFWMLVVFMLSPSSERMTSPMLLLPSPPLPISMSIFCPLVVGSRQ